MNVIRFSDLCANGSAKDKRVFIRADLNVPQDKQGNITEDTRIRASVPAIKAAVAAGAKVMVTSHLGRPTEGEFKPEDSLAPVARRLSELLGRDVPLLANWVDGVQVAPGQVVLLENCRLNVGEKKNKEELARKIARWDPELSITALRFSNVMVESDYADFPSFTAETRKWNLWGYIDARDGAQAVRLAHERRPDLILMDVEMPQMDGFAACRLLKANPATRPIPVIFLSALDEPDERVAGLAMGGVDFVAKPYHPAEVFARVRIHLELAGLRRSAVPTVPATPHDPEEVVAAAAMRLIDDNLGAPLTLAGIARALGTYEKRLSQAFRRHAGMTVFGYLGEARIRRGRQLLADANFVYRAAIELGHPDSNATLPQGLGFWLQRRKFEPATR